MLAHRLPLARCAQDAPTPVDRRHGMQGMRKPEFRRTDPRCHARLARGSEPFSLRLVDARTRRRSTSRSPKYPDRRSNRRGPTPGAATGARAGAERGRPGS